MAAGAQGRRGHWVTLCHRVWGVLVGLVLVLACSPRGPKDIRYGEELCDYCHMAITDPAFAAQLVTRTGKVHVFDDIGDLAAFTTEGRVPAEEVYGIWVNLFLHPADRTPVDDAVFLQSDRLRSPMSSGLAAFRSAEAADSLRVEIGGDVLMWSDVLRRDRVSRRGVDTE
jgi:copper chaperone NosL